MSWLKRKPDPLSERAKALSAEIAALEAQIHRLDTQSQQGPAPPRPSAAAALRNPEPERPAAPKTAAGGEPFFEPGGQAMLKSESEPSTPQHYNELGLRKYDLAALCERIRGWFRGPTASNPKLVNLLAAGSLQGLRPLRYEKRVARRRFILLVFALLLVLLGILSVFVRHH
jgi:cell division protein FtsB